MKLSDVTRIEQTVDPEKVNYLLAKGYRVLKIFSCKVQNECFEEVKPCYILGLGVDK